MPLHPSPAPPADTSRRRLTPASAGYRRSAPADAGLGRLGCKCFETPHWFRRSNKLSHHMPRNISTSGWDVSRLRKTSQSPRAKRGIVGSMRLDVFTTIHRKLKRLIPPPTTPDPLDFVLIILTVSWISFGCTVLSSKLKYC